MNELALFAGAGGGLLGSLLHGWRTVAAVEIEDYPRRILLQRQADGILPRFPVWDDIATFDGYPWRDRVQICTGGFPCQDISTNGKGAGISGVRSRLWGEMARIISEVRPRFVLVENSPMLTLRGLDVVLGDLAAMGFNARWGVIGARHTGAPHKRDRIWILAHTNGCGSEEDSSQSQLRSNCVEQSSKDQGKPHTPTNEKGPQGVRWWDHDPAEPGKECADFTAMDRVAHGVADRVDRLTALGNGQVPSVAALAWEILHDIEVSR